MEDLRIDFHGPSSLANRQTVVQLELPGSLKTISDLHSTVTLDREARTRPCLHQRSAVSTTEKLGNATKNCHLSLSSVESFVLRRLLLDSASPPTPCDDLATEHPRQLSDDILFSVPERPTAPRVGECVRASSKRRSILGLWKAHAAGIGPAFLVGQHHTKRTSEAGRSAALQRRRASSFSAALRPPLPRTMSWYSGAAMGRFPSHSNNEPDSRLQRCSKSEPTLLSSAVGQSLDYGDFCASDKEVRPTDHDSSCSSWEEDERDDPFDAWDILSDEYSTDFGFDTHSLPNSVQILGTGAHDTKAHPHVASPPLLDALMNHLPYCIRGDNFWLKYSLIRDGASLQTLLHYVRSSQYTVLAIETDKGEVFGSFSSSPWRTTFGFFGSAPAFVWKMRHSRQTRCPSLFDQARMESQIDVFPFSGKTGSVQVCKHDLLAIGGDDENPSTDILLREPSTAEGNAVMVKPSGFAFAIQSDLQMGTTSPSGSFQSPALCGSGDSSSVFCIIGLEAWTLTPCRDVDSAEKLELSKYVAEQARSSLKATQGSSGVIYSQEALFRRIGGD